MFKHADALLARGSFASAPGGAACPGPLPKCVVAAVAGSDGHHRPLTCRRILADHGESLVDVTDLRPATVFERELG